MSNLSEMIYIHGGDFPGSHGCIDLMHNEVNYFNKMPSGSGINVYVL